jgi:hypothetical protein
MMPMPPAGVSLSTTHGVLAGADAPATAGADAQTLRRRIDN